MKPSSTPTTPRLFGYTVIGVLTNASDQRWADHFKAHTPEAAEAMAIDKMGDALLIAGVVKGNIDMAS